MTIIDWNGVDLPSELTHLPAGRYVLRPVEDALTAEEEHGVLAALESLRTGKGVADEEARERLRRAVQR